MYGASGRQLPTFERRQRASRSDERKSVTTCCRIMLIGGSGVSCRHHRSRSRYGSTLPGRRSLASIAGTMASSKNSASVSEPSIARSGSSCCSSPSSSGKSSQLRSLKCAVIRPSVLRVRAVIPRCPGADHWTPRIIKRGARPTRADGVRAVDSRSFPQSETAVSCAINPTDP